MNKERKRKHCNATSTLFRYKKEQPCCISSCAKETKGALKPFWLCEQGTFEFIKDVKVDVLKQNKKCTLAEESPHIG